MNISYTIRKEDHFKNVKDVLKGYFKISDRLLLKLKNNDKIFLNNSSCSVRNSVVIDDIVSFSLDFIEDNSNVVPTKMDLNILYEDEYYMVIDKPSGIAIHPSHLHFSNSLSNGIKYYFDSIGLKKKVRPVNRLDMDTSGIVIFAKNEYIQECLIKQMNNGLLHKEYIGIINGSFDKDSGTINLPIGRNMNSIIERCVDLNGSPSITHYQILNKNTKYSIVKFILETGRTHQIRVHCSYLGHSIVGDTLYGSSSDLISRQALHSYKISFVHPITNINVKYISDSYKLDFVNLISNIKTT